MGRLLKNKKRKGLIFKMLDEIELDKLLEWTKTHIQFYFKHRCKKEDRLAYLNEIIKYCENKKGEV